MKTLFYVTYRGFINRLKKALKRPVTYLFIAVAVAYAALLAVGLFNIVKNTHFNNVKALVIVITVLLFFALPSSYLMYARRKGIIFKPSHAHFIFNAPISPKQVLIYGALKNILMDAVFGVLILLGGILLFDVPLWKMILVFLFWVFMTSLQEGGIVILLYGNEKVSVEKMGKASKIMLGVLAVLGIFLFWYIKTYGFSLASVGALIDYPGLQMLPLVGWNVAVFRLILLGPTILNVICSILYVVSTAAILAAAWKLPCYGGYYEEAAKFADDYQAMKNRNKKGETGNGKEKYRRIKGGVKGCGAKAIFYRQLLEYKKARFFIFGSMNLVCFFIAFVMAWTYDGASKYAGMFLLGILAYVIFCTSGYVGKWEKELQNPYLYLIPEKPIKKLWYATQMEHIKSFIDGSIMCVGIGVAWHLPVWQIVTSILLYVLFQAIKMYMRIFALYILGDNFGLQVRKLFQMLIQSSLMGVGIALAVVVGMVINMNLVFPILLIYSIIITVTVMFLASYRFEVLEQIE